MSAASAPEWWQLAPVASATASAVAAIIAAVSVWKTGRNSDRQYSLSYTTDLSRWGGDVLKAYRKISGAYDETLSTNDRFNALRGGANEMIYLFDVGSLILPSPNMPIAKELQSAIDIARVDCETWAAKQGFGAMSHYLESQTRFIDLMRSEVGVSMRHADASRFIK